jgi:hypothetical protein
MPNVREEISEMIARGILSVPNIVSNFKKKNPALDSRVIREEAKELVAEAKMVIKRGY